MNLPNKLTMGRIFAIPVFIVVFLMDYRIAAAVNRVFESTFIILTSFFLLFPVRACLHAPAEAIDTAAS